MKEILLTTASLVLLVVPILYLVKTAQGKVTPNPVTFMVRSIVSVMNLITYFLSNGQDRFKSSVTLISTIGLIAIFLYSLKKGRFSKINRYDVAAGIIALIVAIFWKMSKDPVVANLLLQGAMLISFVPAARGVCAGAAKEQVLPWALAASSYVLMTTALYLDSSTTWQQYVHPICVGFLGNGTLATLIAIKNHKHRRLLPETVTAI